MCDLLKSTSGSGAWKLNFRMLSKARPSAFPSSQQHMSHVSVAVQVYEAAFSHNCKCEGNLERPSLAFSGRMTVGCFSFSAALGSPVGASGHCHEVHWKLTPYPREKDTASETSSLISCAAVPSAPADRHLNARLCLTLDTIELAWHWRLCFGKKAPSAKFPNRILRIPPDASG